MVAATLDLTVEQGATFNVRLTYRNPSPDGGVTKGAPIDVTGCTVELILDVSGAQPGATYRSSDEPSHITLGGADGTVQIKLPPAVTSALTASRTRYVVNLTDSAGDTHRLLQGRLLLSRL